MSSAGVRNAHEGTKDRARERAQQHEMNQALQGVAAAAAQGEAARHEGEHDEGHVLGPEPEHERAVPPNSFWVCREAK